MTPHGGLLDGVKVVEFGGIGPGPHGVMILADLGAEVIRLDRPGNQWVPGLGPGSPQLRGRAMAVANLKDVEDRQHVRDLVEDCDILVEGFRPGVMERMGFGPAECHALNPALVYARVTGWGQDGPRAQTAGHDINYLGLTGALASIGRRGDRPVVPLNLVADYGGGSMLLVIGVLAALQRRNQTGEGVVVDAAMVDGVALLMQHFYSASAAGTWRPGREANRLDGGAPFYRTYRCADGRHVAVGCLEGQFYAVMLQKLGLDAENVPDRDDETQWPALEKVLEAAFAARPRDEWTAVFDGTDACVTPVLEIDEAIDDPHIRARGTVHRAAGSVFAAGALKVVGESSRTPPLAEPARPVAEVRFGGAAGGRPDGAVAVEPEPELYEGGPR
ncbi:CaiB/BaiF CoA transferase family protein [Streptomyces canus]|uniref:CaiB/BaiF CoA transferase family protein n=1 Tax=Streptomyces canus TaxID=58343 RepID=UPI0036899D0E